MNRYTLTLLAAALLSPTTYAQISCTRDGLKAAADLYVAAQTKGDTAGLPLANGLGYVENFKPMAIATLIALRKAPLVRIFAGVRSSQTISTMRRPDSAHMRGWFESAAKIELAPGKLSPMASAMAVIVEAVGDPTEIDELVGLLREFGIKELVRTGSVVMARGSGSIEEQVKR